MAYGRWHKPVGTEAADSSLPKLYAVRHQLYALHTNRIPARDFVCCQPRDQAKNSWHNLCVEWARMKTQHVVASVVVLLVFVGSDLAGPSANAERLSRPDRDSRLQPQCDLCWEPSPNEQSPNRLPTFKPHRPRRPPDSRPHRIPKGAYKLVPNKKHPPSSPRRARGKRHTKLASAQRIIVIDGDTIHIGSERIRLRGLDAPELSEPEGQAAKERLGELLRSESIQIVPHGRDIYDRLVADVFVNGLNVAEMLKSEGYAKSR